MEQTNRTILFEEINANKENLLALVNETEKREGLTDEEIFKIHQCLEVSSFQDFVEKFSPEVNMFLDTNNASVMFSREALGNGQKVISLNEEGSLFSMLIYIMEAKQKKKYVLTTFGDMVDNFFPRDDVFSFVEERNKCIDKLGKNTKNAAKNAERYLKKQLPQFDDGIFLLRLYLKEVKIFLSHMNEGVSVDRGILDDEERMQIKVIKKASKYKNKQFVYKQFDTVSYEQLVTKNICESANTGELTHTKLLRDCLLLPVLYVNKDYITLQKQYAEYSEFYTEIIKKFWTTAKPIMETMLGVKEFFEQYQDVEGMKPTLIISNFSPSDIMAPKNKEKLEIYLRSVNSKIFYQNTIWYAIIPNIATANNIMEKVVRERFRSKHEQYQYQYRRTEIEEVSLLLELLTKYKIQSFLSTALTEDNTFTSFAKKGIDSINDTFEELDRLEEKDYVIPCFPNFRIVSAEEACFSIGQELMVDDLTEKIVVQGEKRLWLDEIGVEASYVAAGLIAACQCPQFLKKHYKRGINEELPGVAYRFTEEGHNLITISNMLSETIEFSEELLEEAISRSRGLLFGQKDGKMIVLTDRVFSYTKANQLSISMVQTVSYLERVIQYETQDFKKNLIHQFFQRRPGSIISQWFASDKAIINAILKENDMLDYTVDDADNACTFSISFNNNELVKEENVSIFIE